MHTQNDIQHQDPTPADPSRLQRGASTTTADGRRWWRLLAVVAGVLALGVALPLPAAAVAPVNKSYFGGVAISGYDPVAYFDQGEAVKGSKDHEYEWNGATWRFASAEHRDAFAAEPEKYAPQYGGYCAYAVANGSTADIDPEAFTIVDGKLYLNYNKKIQSKWEQDIPGYIAKADEEWPKLVDKD